MRPLSESPVPRGTPGSTSDDWKRGYGQGSSGTAPPKGAVNRHALTYGYRASRRLHQQPTFDCRYNWEHGRSAGDLS
jgi:hypothetical protein